MNKKFFAIVCCLLNSFPIYALDVIQAESSLVQKQVTNNTDENVSQQDESIDDVFEKIDVDCVFPIGENCRPACYLRDYNLRFQPAPLDWMIVNDFSKVTHLFETKFEDFLKDVVEIPDKFCAGCRFVDDVANNIRSIHHFKKDIPFEEEHLRVINLMKRYAEAMDNILKKANSVCLICNKNDVSDREFIDFVNAFEKIYSNKKLYLINVIHDEKADNVKKNDIIVNDKAKIIKYTFNDETAIKDNPRKKPTWYGNYYVWEKIANSININQEFKSSILAEKQDILANKKSK